MNNCCNCKFIDSDCIWDEEMADEYFIYHCKKKDEEIDDPYTTVCEYHKKYRIKKYVEQDTVCDHCENFVTCSDLVEVTGIQDIRRHFIPGFDCKKGETE